jgi:hypothetical protein
MAGVFRPARFVFEVEVEPFAFNLFQLDTIDAIIERCAEAGKASEHRDDHADGVLVRQSFPPVTVSHLIVILHPDDDERVIHDEVELAHVPGYSAAAMVRLIDRFADRVRFDEAAHSAAKRAPDDAGPYRSDFLALDPAPGVPILEHKRLREVVDELRAFLEKVQIAGFTLEL